MSIEAISKWYDRRMQSMGAELYYGGSDFYNYGYWEEDTQTPQEASENLVDQLLSFLPVKQGTLLDVACGMGATARHLLKWYEPTDVTAINISDVQLARAAQNAPGCTFLNMNATELNFAEVIDATEPCWKGFQNHVRGWAILNRHAGRLTLPQFLVSWLRSQTVAFATSLGMRHYLLASAEKSKDKTAR